MDKSKNAVAIFNKLAKEYQNKFMDVNLYGDTFDFFCNHITKHAEVLELACGPGNITKYLLNKRPDLKILGTDLSENMIALAKQNNPTAEFKLMDGREIGKINKSYDALMCGFYLPYLSKEETEKLIQDASKILKPKGLLYLSTMEDDYNKSGLRKGSTGDEMFMHFYTEAQLTYIIKQSCFNVLNLQRKVYPAQDGLLTTDLIIIAQKT
jgi:ubiquinone/menaquinone biosynthesis C-methylase UbiE